MRFQLDGQRSYFIGQATQELFVFVTLSIGDSCYFMCYFLVKLVWQRQTTRL